MDVTFGPDTLYGDHVRLNELYSGHLSIHRAGEPDYDRIDHVAGFENPTECFPNAVRWMVIHGYSDDEIKKVIGLNTLRVLKEVWRN